MKTIKVILGIICMLLVNACSTTVDNEVNVLPDNPGIVISSQTFSYRNDNGDNLLTNGTYKDEYLSLIATDENFNDLYIEGILVADIPNIAEIRGKDDEIIQLFFGRTYSYDEINNSSIAYYKLKYDENKYDTITVLFYYNNENGYSEYITDVIYNGVEYPATGTIEIVKEE